MIENELEWYSKEGYDVVKEKTHYIVIGVVEGGHSFCDSLDFEGVHSNTTLGNNKAEQVPCSDTEHALERIQADVVLTTPLKDDS
jgi:hypothetical protein